MLNVFQARKISLIIMDGMSILKPPFKIAGITKIAGDLRTLGEWILKMGPGFILAGGLMTGIPRLIQQYSIQLIPFFTMVSKSYLYSTTILYSAHFIK